MSSSYVKDSDITLSYIQSLIARCGFVDVTDQNPGYACAYTDLNGNLYRSTDLANLRDQLILFYVVQQNS